MSEGAGKPPVVIVNPNTTFTSGTDVQEKMIAAARVFSDLLKPTLGPRGLDTWPRPPAALLNLKTLCSAEHVREFEHCALAQRCEALEAQL